MKEMAQSMTPDEAAEAFYGQDDDSFEKMIDKLGQNDPRLSKVFQNTRRRYLDDQQD